MQVNRRVQTDYSGRQRAFSEPRQRLNSSNVNVKYPYTRYGFIRKVHEHFNYNRDNWLNLGVEESTVYEIRVRCNRHNKTKVKQRPNYYRSIAIKATQLEEMITG